MMKHSILQKGILAAAVVVCAGLIGSGCVTKRDVEEINTRLDRIEQQNDNVQKSVTAMDTIITGGAEADRKLRNDMSTSIDELQRQLSKLLENYSDLTTKIDALGKNKSILRGSVGAQDGSDSVASALPDCTTTYDEAFNLVRKGEYDKAIAGFRGFLTTCPRHASVDQAHYWIGECYYSLEKYVDAVSEFDYLLKSFKGSAKTSQALYKLGRSKQELGQKADAKKVFQRLQEEFAGTLEAEQAKERMKELK